MSDDEDNPFEDLDDAVGDREGDPFETLGEESEDSPADRSEQSARDSTASIDSDNREPDTGQLRDAVDRREPPSEGELFSSEIGPAEQDPSTGGDQPSMDESERAFDVGQRRDSDPAPEEFLSDVGRREGDPFESFEDAFDEMDVDRLDPDVVWQELASAESRGSVGDVKERTYAEVSKHSYCEQCEHFSPPPDVSCGHEGTEIVEFLDMETVRIVDCPIVTEREELEDDDGFGQS
ncbi:MAG: hypothetical protein ACI8TL_001456 [Natronomonas sp.]|jgi:hypothetical protein